MWHKFEHERDEAMTIHNFLWKMQTGEKGCPPNVNPFRWKAMLRQYEIRGMDTLLFDLGWEELCD